VFSFYADEFGTANIHDERKWFVLLAIGFDDRYWKVIDDSVKALKSRYFPNRASHEIEIHSNDIRRAHLNTHQLANIFSTIDTPTLKNFTDELYLLIDTVPLE
jgi:hypothetical protein